MSDEAMVYTRLGRTRLEVSRLCLGTMNFGPRTSAADAFEIMDRALDLGVNFFDTANVYGGDGHRGRTETIVGDWLAQGGRRDRVVLATKVYGQMSERPNESRLSAYHIRQACEDSLRRLKTDRIDLYQMHHIDRNAPWEEVWGALERLVDQGKVLYVGSSNFAGWHIAQAQEIARSRHFLGLVSEQCLYNLTERTVELEILPACREYGVGVIPWSPLARGILAGTAGTAPDGRRSLPHIADIAASHHEPLKRYFALCDDLGERPAHVALAWLLHQDGVTAPIIGPRTMEQLTGALRALRITLDSDALAELDRIWPGPGAPAPEAFAW